MALSINCVVEADYAASDGWRYERVATLWKLLLIYSRIIYCDRKWFLSSGILVQKSAKAALGSKSLVSRTNCWG